MARTVLLHQHSNMLSSLKVHKKKKHAKNPIKTDTFVKNTTFKARKYGNKTFKQTGGNYKRGSSSRGVETSRRLVESRIAADAAKRAEAAAKARFLKIKLDKLNQGGPRRVVPSGLTKPTARDRLEAGRQATLELQLKEVQEVAAKRNPLPPQRVDNSASRSVFPDPVNYTNVQELVAQAALQKLREAQIAQASKADTDRFAALRRAQAKAVAEVVALKLQSAAATYRSLTLRTDAAGNLATATRNLDTYTTTFLSGRTTYITSKETRVELETVVTTITNTVNGITTQVQKNVLTAFLSADNIATSITKIQSVITLETQQLNDAKLNLSELPSPQPSRDVSQEIENYQAAALALNAFVFTTPHPSLKERVLTGISNIIDTATGKMRDVIHTFGDTISKLSGQLLGARRSVESIPGEKQAVIADWVAQFGDLQKNVLSQSQRNAYSLTISDYKTRQSRNSELETSITTFVRAPLPPGKNIYPDSRSRDDAYDSYTTVVKASERITFLPLDPMPTQATSRIDLGEVGTQQQSITYASIDVFNSFDAAVNSAVFIGGASDSVSATYSVLNGIPVVPMPQHSMVDAFRTSVIVKTLDNKQINATLTGDAFNLLRQLALTQGAESQGNQVAVTSQKVTGRRLAQDLKGGIFAPVAKQTSALTPVKDALTTLLNTTENLAEQKLNAQILSDTFGNIVNIYSRLTGSSSRNPTLQTELSIRLNAEIIKFRDTLESNVNSYILFLQNTSPSVLNLWNMPASTTRDNLAAALLDASISIDNLRTQTMLLTGRFRSVLFQANSLLTVRSIRDLQVSIFSSKVLKARGDSVNYKSAVASTFSARKSARATALLFKRDSTVNTAFRTVGSLAGSFKINNARIKRNADAIASKSTEISTLKYEIVVSLSSTQFGITAITKLIKHRPIDAITGMIAGNAALIASVVGRGPYRNNETVTFPIESTDAQDTVNRISLEILALTDDNSSRLTANMVRRLEIGELPLLGRRKGLSSDLILTVTRSISTTLLIRSTKQNSRAMRLESGIRLLPNAKNSNLNNVMSSLALIRANLATLASRESTQTRKTLEKDGFTLTKAQEVRTKTELGLFESFYAQIKNVFTLKQNQSYTPRTKSRATALSQSGIRSAYIFSIVSLRNDVMSKILEIGTPVLTPRVLESMPLSPDVSLLTDATRLRRELNEQNAQLEKAYAVYMLQISEMQKLESLSVRSPTAMLKIIVSNMFFTRIINGAIKIGMFKLRETCNTLLKALKGTDNSRVIKQNASAIAQNVLTLTNKNADMSNKIALKNAALDLKAGEVRKGAQLTQAKGFIGVLRGLFSLKADAKVAPSNSVRNAIKSGLVKTASRILAVSGLIVTVVLAIGGIDVSVAPGIIGLLPNLPDMSILDSAKERLKSLFITNSTLLNYIARARKEIGEIGNLAVKAAHTPTDVLSSIYGAKTAWRAIKDSVGKSRDAIVSVFRGLKALDKSTFIKGFASALQAGTFNVSSKNSILQNTLINLANYQIIKRNINNMGNALLFGVFMFGKLRSALFGNPTAKVIPINLARNTHAAGMNRFNDASRVVTQLNTQNNSNILDVGTPVPPQVLSSPPPFPNTSVLDTAKNTFLSLWNNTARLASSVARHFREMNEINKLDTEQTPKLKSRLPLIHGAKVAYRSIKNEVSKTKAYIKSRFGALKAFDTSLSIKNLFSIGRVNTYEIDTKTKQLEGVTAQKDATLLVKAAEVRKGDIITQGKGFISILKGILFKENAKVIPIDLARNTHAAAMNRFSDASRVVTQLNTTNNSKILDVGTPVAPQVLSSPPTLPNLSVLNNARLLYISLRDRATQLANSVARHFREMNEVNKINTERMPTLRSNLSLIYGAKLAYRSIKNELGKTKAYIKSRFDALKALDTSLSIKNLFSTGRVNAYEIDTKTKQLEGVTAQKNAALLVKAAEVRKGNMVTQGKGLVNILKGILFKENAKVVPIDLAHDTTKGALRGKAAAILAVTGLVVNVISAITGIGTPITPGVLGLLPNFPDMSNLRSAREAINSLFTKNSTLVDFIQQARKEISEIGNLAVKVARNPTGVLSSIYGAKTAWRAIKYGILNGKVAMKAAFNRLKGLDTSAFVKGAVSTYRGDSFNISSKTSALQTMLATLLNYSTLKNQMNTMRMSLNVFLGLFGNLRNTLLVKGTAKVVPIDLGRNTHAAAMNRFSDASRVVTQLNTTNNSNMLDVGTPVPPQVLSPPPALPNTSVLNTAKNTLLSLSNRITQLVNSIGMNSRKMFEISKLAIKNSRILMVAIISLTKIKYANNQLKNATAKGKESYTSALAVLKENSNVDAVNRTVSDTTANTDAVNAKTASLKDATARQDAEVKNKADLNFTKVSLTTFNYIQAGLNRVLFGNPESKRVAKTTNRNKILSKMLGNKDNTRNQYNLLEYLLGKITSIGTPQRPTETAGDKPRIPDNSDLENAKKMINDLSKMNDVLLEFEVLMNKKMPEIKLLESLANSRDAKPLQKMFGVIVRYKKEFNALKVRSHSLRNVVTRNTLSEILNSNREIASKLTEIKNKLDELRNTETTLANTKKDKQSEIFKASALDTVKGFLSNLRASLFGKPNDVYMPRSTLAKGIDTLKSLLQVSFNKLVRTNNTLVTGIRRLALGIRTPNNVPSKPRDTEPVQLKDAQKLRDSLQEMNTKLEAFIDLMNKKTPEIKLLESLANSRDAKDLRSVVGTIFNSKKNLKALKSRAHALRKVVVRDSLSEIQKSNKEIADTLAEIKNKFEQITELQNTSMSEGVNKQDKISTRGMFDVFIKLASDLRSVLTGRVTESRVPKSRVNNDMSKQILLLQDSVKKIMAINKTVESAAKRLELGLRTPGTLGNKPRELDVSQLESVKKARDDLSNANRQLVALNDGRNKQVLDVGKLSGIVPIRKRLNTMLGNIYNTKENYKNLKKSARKRSTLEVSKDTSEIKLTNKEIATRRAERQAKLEELANAETALDNNTASKDTAVSRQQMLETVETLVSNLRDLLDGKPNDVHMPRSRVAKGIDAFKSLLQVSFNKLVGLKNTLVAGLRRLEVGIRRPANLPNKPREPNTSQLTDAKTQLDTLQQISDRLAILEALVAKKIPDVRKLESVLSMRDTTPLQKMFNNLFNYKRAFKALKVKNLLLRETIVRDSLSDIQKSNKDIADTLGEIKNKLDTLRNSETTLANTKNNRESQIFKAGALDTVKGYISKLRASLFGKPNDVYMPRRRLAKGIDTFKSLLQVSFNKLVDVKNTLVAGLRRLELGIKTPDNVPSKPRETEAVQLMDAQKLRDSLQEMNNNLDTAIALMKRKMPEIKLLEPIVNRRDANKFRDAVRMSVTSKMGFNVLKRRPRLLREAIVRDTLSDIQKSNRDIADILAQIKDRLDNLRNTETILANTKKDKESQMFKAGALDTVKGYISNLRASLFGKPNDVHTPRSTLAKGIDTLKLLLKVSFNKLVTTKNALVAGINRLALGIKTPDNLPSKPREIDTSQLTDTQKLRDSLQEMNDKLNVFIDLMNKKMPEIKLLESMVNSRDGKEFSDVVRMSVTSKMGFSALKGRLRLLRKAVTRDALSDVQKSNKDIADTLAEIKNRLDNLRNTETTLANTKNDKESQIFKGNALDTVKGFISNLRASLFGKPNDVHTPRSMLAKGIDTFKSLLKASFNNLVGVNNILVAGVRRLELGIKTPDNVPSKPREIDTSQLTDTQKLRDSLQEMTNKLDVFIDLMNKKIPEIKVLESMVNSRDGKEFRDVIRMSVNSKMGFNGLKRRARLLRKTVTRDTLSDVQKSNKDIADTLAEIKNRLDNLRNTETTLDNTKNDKESQIFKGNALDTVKGFVSKLRASLFGKPNDVHTPRSTLGKGIDTFKSLLKITFNNMVNVKNTLVAGIGRLELGIKIPDNVPTKPRQPDTSQLRDAENLRDAIRKINDRLDAFNAQLITQIPEIKNLGTALNNRNTNVLYTLLTLLSGSKNGFGSYKVNAYSLRKSVTRDSLSDIQKSNKEIANTLIEIKNRLDAILKTETTRDTTKKDKESEIFKANRLETVKGFISNLRASLFGKPNDVHMPRSMLGKRIDAFKSLLNVTFNKLFNSKNALDTGIRTLELGIKIPDSVPTKPRETEPVQLMDAQKLRDSLEQINTKLEAFIDLMKKKTPEIKLLESMVNSRDAKDLRSVVGMIFNSKKNLKALKARARSLRKALIRDSLSDIQKSNREIADTLAQIKNRLEQVTNLQESRAAETVIKEEQRSRRGMLNLFTTLASNLRTLLLGKPNDAHMPRSALNKSMNKHFTLLKLFFNRVSLANTNIIATIRRNILGLKRPDNVPSKPVELDNTQLDNAKKLRDELSRLNEELTALNGQRNKEIPDIEKLSDTLSGRDKLSETINKIYDTIKTYKTLKDSVHERSTPEKLSDKSEIELTNKEIAATLDAIKGKLETLANTETALDSKTLEYNAERSKREILNNVKELVSQLHDVLMSDLSGPHLPKSSLRKDIDAHSNNLDNTIKQLESAITDLVNAAEDIQSALKIPDTLGSKPRQPDTSQLRDAEKLRDTLTDINNRLALLDALMAKQIPEIEKLASVLNARYANPLHKLVSILVTSRNALKGYKDQIHSLKKDLTRDSLSDIQKSNKDIADTLTEIKKKLDELRNAETTLANTKKDKESQIFKGRTLETVKGFVSKLRASLFGKPNDAYTPRSMLAKGIDTFKSLLNVSFNKLITTKNALVAGINRLALGIKTPDNVPSKPREIDTSQLTDAQKLRDSLQEMNNDLDVFISLMNKKIPEIKLLESMVNSRDGKDFRDIVTMVVMSKENLKALKERAHLLKGDVTRDSLSEIQKSNKKIADIITEIEGKLQNIENAQKARDSEVVQKETQISRRGMLDLFTNLVSSLRSQLFGRPTDPHITKSALSKAMKQHEILLDSTVNKLESTIADLVNATDAIQSAIKIPDTLGNKPLQPDTSQLRDAEKVRDNLTKMNDMLDVFYDSMSKKILELENLEMTLDVRSAKPLREIFKLLSGSKKVFEAYKKNAYSLRKSLTRDSLSDIQKSNRDIADTLTEIKNRLNTLRNTEATLANTKTNKQSQIFKGRTLETVKGFVSKLRASLFGKPNDVYMPRSRVAKGIDTFKSLLNVTFNKLVTTKNALVAGLRRLQLGIKTPDNVPNKPRQPDTSQLTDAQKLRDSLEQMNNMLDVFIDTMNKKTPEIKLLESMVNSRDAKDLRDVISMVFNSKYNLKALKDKTRSLREAITRDSLSEIQRSKKEIADTLIEIKNRFEQISRLQEARTAETVRKEGEMLTHDMLDIFTALVSDLHDALSTKPTDSHIPKGILNQALKRHESVLDSTIKKLESVLTDVVNATEAIQSALKTPDILGDRPSDLDNSQLENAKKLRDELSRLNEELAALNAERNKEIPDIEKLSDTLSARDSLPGLLEKILQTAHTYKSLKDSLHERSTPEKLSDKSEIELTNKEIAATLDAIKGKLETLTNTENALDSKTLEYNAERSKREILNNVKELVSQLHDVLMSDLSGPHLPKSTLRKDMDAHSNNLDTTIKQLESAIIDLVNATEGMQSALKIPDTLGSKPVEPDTSQLTDAQKLRDMLTDINTRLDAFNEIMTKQVLEIGTLESVLNVRGRLRGVIIMLAGYKNAFNAYKNQIHLSREGVLRDNASDIDATNKKIADTLNAINNRLDTLADTETTLANTKNDKESQIFKGNALDTVKGFISNLRASLFGKPNDVHTPRSMLAKGIDMFKSLLNVTFNKLITTKNTVVAGINRLALGIKTPNNVPNKPSEPDTSQLRDAEKARDDLRKMNDRLDALYAILSKKIPDIQKLQDVLNNRKTLREAFILLSSYKDAFNAYKTHVYSLRESIRRDNASDIQRINKETIDNISKINEALTRLSEMENARDAKSSLFGYESSRSNMLKQARDMVASLRNELLKLTEMNSAPRTLERDATQLNLTEAESNMNNLQKDQSDVDNGIDEIGNPEPPTRELGDEPTPPDSSDLLEARRLRDSLNDINNDLTHFNDMRKKNIDEIGNLEDASAMRKRLGETIETLANLKMLYKLQKDSVHNRDKVSRDNANDINNLKEEIAKTMSEINDKLARLAETEEALNAANKNKDVETSTIRMIKETRDAVLVLKDILDQTLFDPNGGSKIKRDAKQAKLDKLAEDIADLTENQTEIDNPINDMGTPEPSRNEQFDKPTEPDTSELDAAKNLRDRLTEANDRLSQILEVSKNQSTDIENLYKTLSRRLELSKLIKFITREKLLWKSIKDDFYSKRQDLTRDGIDNIKALEKNINDTLNDINNKIDALREAESQLDFLTKDRDGNTNIREMIQTTRDTINALRETLRRDPSDPNMPRKPERKKLEADLKRLESDIRKLEDAMLKLDDTINETNPREPSERNLGDKPMPPDDSVLKLAKDMRDMLEITNRMLHDRSKSLGDISDHINTIRESIALRIEEINTLKQSLEQTANKRFKEKEDAMDARRKAEEEAQRLKDEDLRKKKTEDDYNKRKPLDLDPFSKRKDEAAQRLKDKRDDGIKKKDENDRLQKQRDALLNALKSINIVNTAPTLGLPPSLLAGVLSGIGALGLGPSIFSGSTPPSSGQEPPQEEGAGNGSADGEAAGTAAGTADGDMKAREEARRQYSDWLREQESAQLASSVDDIEASAEQQSNANNVGDPEIDENNPDEVVENQNSQISR